MSQRLAIDANLLVLLAVGQVEPALIAKHKRLRSDYSVVDFGLLTRVIAGFRSVVITPNSATEAANLIVFGVNNPLRATYLAALGIIFTGAEEFYQPSRSVSQRPDYRALGLTDAAWLSALDKELVLLTADRELYVAAVSGGAKAYLFKDVRDGHQAI